MHRPLRFGSDGEVGSRAKLVIMPTMFDNKASGDLDATEHPSRR
jgi:hypothetical protein